ncbi:hypothetical protein Gotri_005534 [Gossypium trilobum]|uniref:Phytocyanin domain-containing protein n=1 Tax=Gossypium trilobum TaxID=34281 RepID=A0A7J9EWV3_9ROSI|nr:hypothetical protein [Gossypium trilobum]
MRRRAIIMVILMVLQFGAIHSKPTTYMVGDEDGWDSGLDMEVFTYDGQQFDVAVVNQTGHDSCTLNEGAKVFHSGNDKIQLAFGANYFIDTVADLCAAGMKMAINATAPPPSV